MAGKYKPFGVDLDPNNELDETILPDGDVAGSIRGERLNYDNVIDELEERATRVHEGKPPVKPRSIFHGIGDSRINEKHLGGCSCLACKGKNNR